MLAVLRVRGKVRVSPQHRKALEVLMLHKVNHLVLVRGNDSNKKMVESAKDYVTFGEIDEPTLEMLLRKRGRTLENRRIDDEFLKHLKVGSLKALAKELIDGKKSLKELGIKPVFRLNSPSKGYERGGIKQGFAVGGALGYRAGDINSLINRMA